MKGQPMKPRRTATRIQIFEALIRSDGVIEDATGHVTERVARMIGHVDRANVGSALKRLADDGMVALKTNAAGRYTRAALLWMPDEFETPVLELMCKRE